MVKRAKRLKTGIESLKKEIESHLKKIKQDINNKDFDMGKYHIKEVNRSLIHALRYKLEILGIKDKDVEKYEKEIKKLNENRGEG